VAVVDIEVVDRIEAVVERTAVVAHIGAAEFAGVGHNQVAVVDIEAVEVGHNQVAVVDIEAVEVGRTLAYLFTSFSRLNSD